MKKIQKSLLLEFYSIIIITLILVIVFEFELLMPITLPDNNGLEFAITTAMELITICFLPLTLKLFKFKIIHNILKNAPEKLFLWGNVRLIIFGFLVIFNTLFYYTFMNVAFAYMAIISLLCMFFIYPSMIRCNSETE